MILGPPGPEGLGDLALVLSGAVLGGLVRGFSGFGTAMIYLPFAGQVMPPVWALTTLLMMDLIGPVPNIVRSFRAAQAGDLRRLLLGAAAGVPLGVFILAHSRPEVFRYTVSILALFLLGLLLAGFRHRGGLSRRAMVGTGALGGFLGGVAGLPGPPVILLYMSGPHTPAEIRATTMIYLFGIDVMLMSVFVVSGLLDGRAILLGLGLAVPYLLSNLAGAAIFRPGRARLYRGVAYCIIAASAVRGLPLWH
ncbi:MAG: sulfite exporter TauE/SafE family protein [Alphaproteobacteria bacterium]|nr:MAG: sulfite exporter TauE/SafE family protein [Alphaproteobacteria bacterium]